MTAGGPAPVKELLKLARSFVKGEYGIALGGAHAKGIEDTESDLDIYVFSESAADDGTRSQLAARFDPRIREVVSWGGNSPFVQAGTDFYFAETRIECWLRNTEYVEGIVADCAQGDIRRELTVWTPTGFYNYCALSDLNVMRPLEDPCGLLARWQERIREYPPKLAEAIARKFLGEASFWPRNFHYSSAVKRRDAIYCTAIAQQVVHNLIQVLFALNRVYFPGDKKLAGALEKLPLRPADLNERIERILLPAAKPAVEDLESQQVLLQGLFDEVAGLAERRKAP